MGIMRAHAHIKLYTLKEHPTKGPFTVTLLSIPNLHAQLAIQPQLLDLEYPESDSKTSFKLSPIYSPITTSIEININNLKANGVVERGHFNIRESILKACGYKVYQWPDKVAPAFFADRVTVSQTTGWSAYYLLHSVHPVLPLDLFKHTLLVTGFKE